MKKLSVFIYSRGGGCAERVVSNLLGELTARYEVHLVLMNERIFYEIPSGVQIHFIEKSAPFENGLLEYPQYTHPPVFEGKSVPDVLRKGNHEAIKRWKRREALRKTFQKRPDLLYGQNLSEEDFDFLRRLKEGLEKETDECDALHEKE